MTDTEKFLSALTKQDVRIDFKMENTLDKAILVEDTLATLSVNEKITIKPTEEKVELKEEPEVNEKQLLEEETLVVNTTKRKK